MGALEKYTDEEINEWFKESFRRELQYHIIAIGIGTILGFVIMCIVLSHLG